MASGLITPWQIQGEKVEAVLDFIFLGSNITADSDYSHDIQRPLLLERKAMTNLDSVLKSRDVTLQTKVGILKAMVFPVVMYRCESWTRKKAECWIIGGFELWCWRRLLRVSWTARYSSQSSPEGNQPWIFIGRTDTKAPILWPPDVKSRLRKDPDAGKDWRQKETGTTEDDIVRSPPTQRTWIWANSRRRCRTGKPSVLQS